MRRVLLYTRNEAFGLKVLYCLRHAGFAVDILAEEAGNSTRYSRYRSRFKSIPDRSRVAAWINEQAPIRKWEAVLADSIVAHGFLHSIRHELSVPAFAPASIDLLEECHNKWELHRRLEREGMPTIPSVLLKSVADLNPEVSAAVGFPLVTKPLGGESGYGIKRFETHAALVTYLLSNHPEISFPMALQRHVDGPTLGLSFLAVDGEIVRHDLQLDAADGSRVFHTDTQLLEAGRKIVRAFGYAGPGHIDFIRNDESGEVYAIDFNCRFWFSVILSTWKGGNFPECAIRIARGEPLPMEFTRPGVYYPPGALVKLIRRKPGSIGRIDRDNWAGFWQAVSDPLPHLAHLTH